MAIKIFTEQVKIHETPLERILFDGSQIKVEFDDEDEKRWCAVFSRSQGLRVTAIDCFEVSNILIDGKKPPFLLIEDNSKWINCLNIVLNRTDYSANFLENSKHYIFPFQDNIVEVISSDIRIDELK